MQVLTALCTLSVSVLALGGGANYTNPFTQPCDTKGRFANLTMGAGAICTPQCKGVPKDPYTAECPMFGKYGTPDCIGRTEKEGGDTFCHVKCRPCDPTFCPDGATCLPYPFASFGVCLWKYPSPPVDLSITDPMVIKLGDVDPQKILAKFN
mmetsp:Transcript_3522/g.6671  ORF Transcript_3522/g.6671 Transcript_3522/m.6671 type:complete len:152 (-) Transcript_3522:157-612(-)